jgi:putative ABC transport system permease protein
VSAPDPHPPALAEWLLARALPDDAGEPVLGDLEECFRERVADGHDLRAARRWYWRETLAALFARSRLVPRASAVATTHHPEGPAMSVLADLRHAARVLARRPGFTTLAALTLAVGIGATTAIYSAVSPILFEPLPYPRPDRIVMVWERALDGTTTNTGFATYADLARDARSLDAIAALASWAPTMTGRAEPTRLEGERVSASYFRVLGVRPALGRDFRASDDSVGAERVTILSHGLWRSRFGGDSSLVGRAITLDGRPYVVVGIAPEGFDNVLDPSVQMWTPLRYDASLPYACRTCRHLRAVARLADGATLASASRELDALSARLVREHPADYARAGFPLVPLREQITGGARPALLAVLGAVALLLLIACANVTNLLLARGAQRRGEFAIRSALGAGRGRVLRQLMTESLLLAAIGGACGVGVAALGVRALVAMSPSHLPRLEAIRVDARVLAFALAITTIVGLLFGLLPALDASRGDLRRDIERAARRTTGATRLTRSALVVSEVALALTLVLGAGLLLQSMRRLLAVSPGFDASGVLTMQVLAAGPRFNEDTATHGFYDRALERVRALPGVESAAFTTQLPLSGDFDAYGVHIESHPRANPEEDPSAHRYAVSAGYLETMRIPLVRGRSIVEGDSAGRPMVVLINASFARRAFPGEEAIGQRMRVGAADGPPRTIVGIVGDVRQVSLAAETPMAVYVPESQWPYADQERTLVVRTRGDAASLAGAVRRAVWSVDRDQPIVRVETMERLIASSAAERRFALVLFEAFAMVALVMAAAGIYGVLAGSVADRVREIGVRAALGATRRDLIGMVLGEGLAMIAAGVVLGLAAALAASRVIAGMLFGVSRLDPLTYAAVTGVLVLVALVACWAPAWRAARVDPIEALRSE